MINIVKGSTNKPISSQVLADFFTAHKEKYSGELFIGYPIIAGPEGATSIDAVWISPERGIVLFTSLKAATLLHTKTHKMIAQTDWKRNSELTKRL